MIDARTIFIHKAIKQLNPELQIFSEIGFQSNIDFLLDKGKTVEGTNYSTLYAAGEVYIASTIDTLTA
jgi:predicted lactoylglutathione lyase